MEIGLFLVDKIITFEVRSFLTINFIKDRMIQFQLQLYHTIQFFFLNILITKNLKITFLELPMPFAT